MVRVNRKRRAAPRRKAPRRKAPRRKGGKGMGGKQFASMKETVSVPHAINSNQLYNNFFSLNQFPRASAVAPNFKWYRAVKVEWEYLPIFNTFQEEATVGSLTGYGVPYLYMLMNRTQDSYSPSVNAVDQQAWIESSGARPRTLSSKKVFTYKPNWCSSGLLTNVVTQGTPNQIASIAPQGLKKEFGWLACPNKPILANGQILPGIIQPVSDTDQLLTNSSQVAVTTNNVVYNGHDIFVQQTNAAENTSVASAILTVHWEFKDANGTIFASPL